MLNKRSTDFLKDINEELEGVPMIEKTVNVGGSVSVSDLKTTKWYDEKYVVPYEANELWHTSATYSTEIPFTVNVYGVSKSDAVKYMRMYGDKLAKWIFIMIENKRPCIRELTLHWLLYDVPKRGRSSSSEMVIKHMVNTGFTYRCKSNNTITLYRIEDAYKVFVHETMHSFGYDVMLLDSPSTSKLHYGVYTVDMYEVCCEFFARYVAIANNRVPESALKANVKWGLLQASKFLGEKEFKDLLRGKTDSEYKEETPAFSYYVATGILLYAFCYDEVIASSYYEYIKKVMEAYMTGERRYECDHLFMMLEDGKKMDKKGGMQMIAP